MSRLMEEHYLISAIMSKLTHDISIDVEFCYLKSRLVRILTTSDLQRAECKPSNMEKMAYVCECCARLSMENFVLFVAAVREQCEHVFDQINSEYRSRTGRDLPAVQDFDNGRIASSSPAHSQQIRPSLIDSQQQVTLEEVQSSSPLTNASASNNVSQSGGLPASQAVSSSNLASSGFREPNLPPGVSYRSYGPAVQCSPDETVSIPNTSTEEPQDTAGGSQALHESLLPSENPHPPIDRQATFTESQDQGVAGAAMMTKYEKEFRDDPTNVYRMEGLPRGRCIIINNQEFQNLPPRAGSHADFENLKRMFTFLGFELLTHNNKKAAEILDILKNFAKSPGLGDVSALAVVILSHGGINDCIYGYDGAADHKVPKQGTFIMKFDLQQMFINRNCPLMEGKPKLFIIQACRGDVEDMRDRNQDSDCSTDGSQNRENQSSGSQDVGLTESDSPSPENVADTADMCFIHSASLGYKAYRSTTFGSPFVEHFKEAVVRSAHEKNLHKIVMELQRKFRTKLIGHTKMTMPDLSSYLTKEWYFNPPAEQ